MPKFKQHKSQDIWYSSHSTPVLEVTRCVSGWMPTDMVMMLQVPRSQCMPTSWKGGTMRTCHGPSQERSPSHCSTNWKIRHSISFPWDNEATRRVVGGERDCTGSSYTQLDAQWNCQHLKDDCLYFSNPVKPWLACTAWNHHAQTKQEYHRSYVACWWQ